MLTKDDAPSHCIECLPYNVPGHLFERKLAPTYVVELRQSKSISRSVHETGSQTERFLWSPLTSNGGK